MKQCVKKKKSDINIIITTGSRTGKRNYLHVGVLTNETEELNITIIMSQNVVTRSSRELTASSSYTSSMTEPGKQSIVRLKTIG